MPRRVASLGSYGAIVAGLVLAFVTWRSEESKRDRAAIHAQQAATDAKVDRNSERIDESTATAQAARADHIRILAELRAIRERIGAPEPESPPEAP